ncbi:hypothetical protein [Neisseria uirgultaei]|uniref:hypothetical protein n=1 Tax=Neisseria uirgultaei TaxID=2830646 RepID=UPI0026589683|nr:hypothetical protein [Neisseria uirgultaei]
MPSERNRVSDGILSDGAQTESVYRQNPFRRIGTVLPLPIRYWDIIASASERNYGAANQAIEQQRQAERQIQRQKQSIGLGIG